GGAPQRAGQRGRLRRVLSGLRAVAAILLVIGLAIAIFGASALIPGLFSPGNGKSLVSPDLQLSAVSMVSADEGWAVGARDGPHGGGKPSPLLLHYIGRRRAAAC